MVNGSDVNARRATEFVSRIVRADRPAGHGFLFDRDERENRRRHRRVLLLTAVRTAARQVGRLNLVTLGRRTEVDVVPTGCVSIGRKTEEPNDEEQKGATTWEGAENGAR